jgi:DNA segregation ATPase FtsK/SpoIIIE, S-DNA-T family
VTALPPASRCWTIVGDEGAVDVELHCPDDTGLPEVLDALGSALGVPVPGLWAGSVRLSDTVTLTDPALRHGALLGLGRPVPRALSDRPGGALELGALELHVVGGPEAGRVVPLATGRHVVGRGSEATVPLDDPDVSRRHVVVQVGGGAVTVADAGSANGSRLDDQDLDEPRAWPAGAVLRCGASSLALAAPGAPGASLEAAPGGRLRLRPAARLGAPPPDVEVAFPRPPSPPPRRRLAWVAVALPAVGGVLMAWLLHAPTFLFFALLSPVVALGTWLSERWSGRRSGRREALTHAHDLAAAEDRVAAAVRAHVRAAEAAAPDLATLAAAVRRRSRLLWGRTADAADALVVRVGSGPGPTRVTRVLPEGGRLREPAPHLPVVVDLIATGGLGVVGPRERAAGVLRAVIAQAVALHPPGHVDLFVLTEPGRLGDWAWTRWLPHLAAGAVHLGAPDPAEDEILLGRLRAEVARRRSVAERSDRSCAGRLLVLVDRPLPPRLAAVLVEARDAGVLLLTAASTTSGQPVAVGALLRLAGETGDLGVLSRRSAPDQAGIVIDRLPLATAAGLARDLAAVIPAATPDVLPHSIRLAELPGPGLRLPDGADRDGAGGEWSDRRDRLTAVLGSSVDGPVHVDLCRDGPHALVAGTTGSGKSELLQTLITGLALAHPPDRCAFLLVDYKGGAAFGPAVDLPHTVGVVTDLDGQSTARALRSLAAELSRREAVLAAHGEPDIAGLPPEAELGRLVIVVDEFATLAEELPEFVPGLISIAQRGRSLGVHLVLATQRPGGVVSPEIRANCTLRICLRTTDESDSRDVLGVPDAAHLPVVLPGRALLRSGSAPPILFQAARVATPRAGVLAGGPVVRRWTWPTAGPAPTTPRSAGETDLAAFARYVTAFAATRGGRLPHRPWCPPLPETLPAAALDPPPASATAPTGRLRVGLLDRPDRQSQEPLELDLDDPGTWLAVGGPRSGRTTLLRTVLAEAVHRYGAEDLHVHVLATGGSPLTRDASELPHTGTVVDSEDALRVVRLVDRLAQEVAARRATTAVHPRARVLLLVDGLEAVGALLDDADPAHGSGALLRLARDGAAAGLTCVLTTDRAAPGSRVAAVARERLVLPLPDRADYAVAGISPRAVPGCRPPGRALVGEDAVECQFALPRPLDAVPRARPLAGSRPVAVVELPPDPEFVLPAGRIGSGRPEDLAVPLGPGGDEGMPVTVDLLRAAGLLVTGPPRSGRSRTLAAVAAHVTALGVPLLWLGHPPGAVGVDDALDPGDTAGLAAWASALPHALGVVLADDVGSPAEWPVLTALPPAGSGPRVVLVAASTAGQLAGHFQGPVAALRRDRSGLLLCPGPGDGDLLGMRLPRMPLPVRPGSGWLATGGLVQRVQIAARRRPAPAARVRAGAPA